MSNITSLLDTNPVHYDIFIKAGKAAKAINTLLFYTLQCQRPPGAVLLLLFLVYSTDTCWENYVFIAFLNFSM